jgi:amidase
VTLPSLDSVSVAELAEALENGTATSRSIVEAHLQRIAEVDPAFGSIRCLAPDALRHADASDAIRAERGPRGPLEGIPVLIKDNVDVAGLPTTAGALALAHSMPAVDAPLVARLRAGGAIILGKTNLSELANFLTEGMPSGYSSLGGQVLNPYDTSLTPSGSSSGSGAAVALGLAPLAIGTETDGSIISPAEHQSLVGFKPTLGLVSRTGIVPISSSQDTAGPMTRTVADAAVLLAAIWGPDPDDPATASAVLSPTSLGAEGLVGVRLGVVRAAPSSEPDPEADARRSCHDMVLELLRAAGAELVDVTLPEIGREDEMTVLHYEFGAGMDRYLTAVGVGASVPSMAALRDWNLAHAEEALKFGQAHVDQAVAIDHDTAREAYLGARARDLQAVTSALRGGLGSDLEALVFAGADGYSLAARAGWPSVVVPAGYTTTTRRPVGVMLVSPPWSDGRLLALASAVEQAIPPRRPPAEINPAAFRRLACFSLPGA